MLYSRVVRICPFWVVPPAKTKRFYKIPSLILATGTKRLLYNIMNKLVRTNKKVFEKFTFSNLFARNFDRSLFCRH